MVRQLLDRIVLLVQAEGIETRTERRICLNRCRFAAREGLNLTALVQKLSVAFSKGSTFVVFNDF